MGSISNRLQAGTTRQRDVMTLKKRLEKIEMLAADQDKIDIPLHKWAEKDRTEIERLTGIKFTFGGEK